jgi:peptide/nickel transport system substrate-binding protein
MRRERPRADRELRRPRLRRHGRRGAPRGGTFDVELPIDIGVATGLDPQLADVASAWQLMSLVYETLVTIGPDFSVQPGLAESWETPTPTTYVFHLREGVAFSNWRSMVADDVVGSVARLLASQSVWRGQLGPVSSVTAVDLHTVRVELGTTYTPFLAALANVPASVLPMKEINEGSIDVATTMLGTGPFTVADHRQDVSWRFARNKGYWAPGAPHLDGVNVTIATEDAARVASLQSGRPRSPRWATSTPRRCLPAPEAWKCFADFRKRGAQC